MIWDDSHLKCSSEDPSLQMHRDVKGMREIITNLLVICLPMNNLVHQMFGGTLADLIALRATKSLVVIMAATTRVNADMLQQASNRALSKALVTFCDDEGRSLTSALRAHHITNLDCGTYLVKTYWIGIRTRTTATTNMTKRMKSEKSRVVAMNWST